MSDLSLFLNIHPIPKDLVEVHGVFDFTKTISKPYWVFVDGVSWDTVIRCQTGTDGWVEYKEQRDDITGPVIDGKVRVFTTGG